MRLKNMWGRILRILILDTCSTVMLSPVEGVQLKSLYAVYFATMPMLQFDRGIGLELLTIRSIIKKRGFP